MLDIATTFEIWEDHLYREIKVAISHTLELCHYIIGSVYLGMLKPIIMKINAILTSSTTFFEWLSVTEQSTM